MLIRYKDVVLVVLCVLFPSPAICLSSVIYDDGNTHTLSTVINDNVYVSGTGTHIIMTSTGGISYPYGFYASGSSIITINGGDIQGRGLNLTDNVQLTMTGGDFSSGISLSGSAGFYLTGGSCKSYIGMIENSIGIISYFNAKGDLFIRNNSHLVFMGGSIGGRIFAGSAYQENHSSLIQFAGYDFKVNGVSISIGSSLRSYSTPTIYDGELCLTGRLTGTLTNGGTLNNTFYIYDASDIVVIPEPAAMLFLAFGSLLLRKR